MSEFDGLPTLRTPIAVAAFAGWNDAGESATGVIEHLENEWGATPLAALDPEDYYDFQVHRPQLSIASGGDTEYIEWPTTRVSYCTPPGAERDIVLIRGIEPNMRWRAFCEELLDLFLALEVDTVVLLGALLSDTPHTRPLPITGSATDAALITRYDITPSRYEGPTGIVGVLQEACGRVDITSMSFWVQVPHYVGQQPCPKANLALLHRLEDVLDMRMPLGELAEQAADWESAVNEAASADAEMADYVRSLEQREGEARPHQPSGDELAKMFEKYLRRPGANPD
ncbi:MAG: PAC2 family protein [Corynebacteriales bacterium]|nr:PAC2 family protein [Mycobacteriales bacterium]